MIKRYSQFLDLKNRMEKETIRPSAPFPKKGGIVALSASAMAKRREGLHDYMVELSGYVTNTRFRDLGSCVYCFIHGSMLDLSSYFLSHSFIG